MCSHVHDVVVFPCDVVNLQLHSNREDIQFNFLEVANYLILLCLPKILDWENSIFLMLHPSSDPILQMPFLNHIKYGLWLSVSTCLIRCLKVPSCAHKFVAITIRLYALLDLCVLHELLSITYFVIYIYIDIFVFPF